MQPSDKHPGMNDLINSLAGRDRQSTISAGHCMTCDKENVVGELRDNLSRKEYTISGMCQTCQDETFNDPEEY